MLAAAKLRRRASGVFVSSAGPDSRSGVVTLGAAIVTGSRTSFDLFFGFRLFVGLLLDFFCLDGGCGALDDSAISACLSGADQNVRLVGLIPRRDGPVVPIPLHSSSSVRTFTASTSIGVFFGCQRFV